jgi:Tfp pilus assembly protein PilX
MKFRGKHTLPRQMRGATLVVALILLTLIALAVGSAFMLSSTNLQSVGNMQQRNEAIAAANEAAEAVITQLLKPIGGAAPAAPAAYNAAVDIESDDQDDYTVVVAAPTCIEAIQVAAGTGAGMGSSESLNPSGAGGAYSVSGAYNTLWEISATATNTASGVAVTVNQGVRILIPEATKTAYCN